MLLDILQEYAYHTLSRLQCYYKANLSKTIFLNLNLYSGVARVFPGRRSTYQEDKNEEENEKKNEEK